MAKKKSSKKNTKIEKEFSSSPFKSLKGLSAFTKSESQGRDVAMQIMKGSMQGQGDAQDPKGSSCDQESFADEMDFLGVQALPGRGLVEPEEVKVEDVKTSSVPQLSREDREAAAFLDAIGSVEKIFKDEWPENEPVKRAVPRRMKQVERGQLKPEDELDLHGLNVAEASAKIRFFLQDSIYHGFQTVLIITGKGLHSNDGPVLRQAMEKLLDQLCEQVVEWGVAPRRYGGSGALVVFLRKSAAE
jgi:DNA-nicking Smr family endonuclease